MLKDLFRSPRMLGRLRSGPAGPFLEGFAAELESGGYSRLTTRAHLSAAAHLCHWAASKGLTISSLDDAIGLRFRRHLSCCRCRPSQGKYANSAGASEKLFRNYLCQTGAITPGIAQYEETKAGKLLNDFRQWMIQNRGLSHRTLDEYRPIVASLLDFVEGDPGQIDFRKVREFIIDRTARHGKSNFRGVTTALRTFLRYLLAEGKCQTGLDAALPAVAQWRLSALPRYLPASDVERVLAACDPSTETGSRDRAIVLLLARLGLRASDVVGLRITDIDWENASIRVSGKGRTEVRLPLTQEIGDALLNYLEHGRPAVDSDHVFTRAIAPRRPFSNSGLVSKVVARAIKRAGIVTTFRGAHVLRHSAATGMLQQGMTLQDIGSILRHRSIETTAHYAKVDVKLLQLVVQPWPEVSSC